MELAICTPRVTTKPSSIGVPLRRREDAVLCELIDRYSTRGGLASPDEIIAMMRPYWRQPISVLAKWIVAHKVVSFMSNSRILLPLFQFERPRMTPIESVAEAVPQLAELMDDEGVAAWFIRPCEWLGYLRPMELVATDPEALVCAAHRMKLALVSRRLAG